jgi:hypothetical protein
LLQVLAVVEAEQPVQAGPSTPLAASDFSAARSVLAWLELMSDAELAQVGGEVVRALQRG